MDERDYHPLPAKAEESLLEKWRLYRQVIGLEADLVAQLKKAGKSELEIEQGLSRHREARQQILPTFHKQIGAKI